MIGIGSVHKQAGEISAYLYSWGSTFILRPSSIAVITLTASQYFLSGVMKGKLIPVYTCIFMFMKYLDCKPTDEVVKITAIFAIRIFTLLFLIHIHHF